MSKSKKKHYIKLFRVRILKDLEFTGSMCVCEGGGGLCMTDPFLTFMNDLQDNIRSSICGQSLANEVQCGQMSLHESDSFIE